MKQSTYFLIILLIFSSCAFKGKSPIDSIPTPLTGRWGNSLNSTPPLHWSSANGAASYAVSIGTSPGLSDASAWKNVGNVNQTYVRGVTLTEGTRYYSNLRALTASGDSLGEASTSAWTVRTQGVFAPFVSLAMPSTSGNGPRSVLLADMNGDHHLDLLSSGNDNQVSLELGLGNGSFGARVDLPITGSGQGIVVADLNQDSKMDIFTVCFNLSHALFFGNGDGSFGARVDLTHNQNETAGAAVDLNEDGRLDLVTSVYDQQAIAVRMSSAPGTFGTRTITLLTSDTTANPFTPKDLKVADLNRDGHADLLVSNESNTGNYGGNIAVLLGRGDGTFQNPIYVPVYQGNALKQIVVRDFDGDGNLDFAVANYGMNQIAVLKGAGDGTFTRLTEVSAGAGTFGLETTDLNGDGVMDLVASNASSSTLSISLGNGDGSFTSASNYPTGSFPQRLSIGDTNEDGLPDLAVSSRAGDSVSLLLMQDAH